MGAGGQGCSTPPSQIIPSVLEGALLSVGYPSGMGMNCLRGWLSPRATAVPLTSCLGSTQNKPSINLQLTSIRDSASSTLLLARPQQQSPEQAGGTGQGSPVPADAKRSRNQGVMDTRGEQADRFLFFFFIRLGNIIYCIKINLLQ